MNKKNKILVGCLALLLVLSVGYALFSQTVTINGTATAKGDFDITYECYAVITAENSDEWDAGITGNGTGNCSISGQTITTASNFTMPGDSVIYIITIKNTGTIPAVLKTADSSNNLTSTDENAVYGDAVYYDRSTGFGAMYYVSGPLTLDNAGKFVEQENTESYQSDSDIENAQITIEPGELISAMVFHSWADMGSNQPELPENGANMVYDITFGFEQVTSN